MSEAKEFYDFLAPDYDRMTRFVERLERERELLRGFLADAQPHSGLDLGCGTGLHTIALAQLGLKITGVDLSPEMIARARQNAAQYGLKYIRWEVASLEDFPEAVGGAFDLIVCLGNTLAHVGPAQLPVVLANFHRALNPGGRLVLQLLNYVPVLRRRNRIVDVRRVEGKIYLRFYDFLPGGLRFNLLILAETDSGIRHSLRSAELFPHTPETLAAGLKEAGFEPPGMFANLQKEAFGRETSKNLVLTAVRP